MKTLETARVTTEALVPVKNKALITGISGQDGSYLSEFLLDKGYEVAGIIRRSSEINTKSRLSKIKGIQVFHGDVTDIRSVEKAVEEFKPTEVYNLAAQSFVGLSWDQPFYTTEVNAVGALNVLSVLKDKSPDTRYYQASTSEMFGKVQNTPQNEDTPFYPRSPYGIAKLFAHWTTVNYRESHGLYACSGILFNHESERRGAEFITRKLTLGISALLKRNGGSVKVGNMNASRDWGYAPDYVEAMWLMLQQDTPSDYVIATGESHTIREFIFEAFKYAGITVVFSGQGVNEKVLDKTTGKVLVEVDPGYYRPNEVDLLKGDSTKAKQNLYWEPKVRFQELVGIMMEHDMWSNK
jgi:GDPmannose 4,6-dehydratase